MKKLIFRGTAIRFLDMRAKDGILFSRLHLTADMTKPIADEMGLDAALDTDGWDSMKLAGAVRLSEFRMKVSGLTQELRMKAEEARDFVAVRVMEGESEATHVELRFSLVTADHPALVYEYWKAVGEGKAELWVTLQDEPQADLPLAEEETKQLKFACDHCDEDVPLEGAEHILADGSRVPCEHANAGPPLASRAEMERAGA